MIQHSKTRKKHNWTSVRLRVFPPSLHCVVTKKCLTVSQEGVTKHILELYMVLYDTKRKVNKIELKPPEIHSFIFIFDHYFTAISIEISDVRSLN